MAKNAQQSLPVILRRLHEKYPNAKYELNWETPVQLLVATILAAQCTDERVNQVTATLFRKYPDAEAFADAVPDELAEAVKPTGYYRTKAQAIQAACRAIVDNFAGEVPRTMEEMLTLPRVARKTANVVLNNAYNLPTGIIVDTHVARVSQRLGLVENDKPEKIETELMELVPQSEWIFFGPAMVLHGRYTCTAINPQCGNCMLQDLCPKLGVGDEADEDYENEDEPPRTRKSAASRPAATPAPQSKPPVTTGTASSSRGGGNLKVEDIPAGWRSALADEFKKPYWSQLVKFVNDERSKHTVFPPEDEVFTALKLTPYDEVKVLLLGQDPYHDDGQAHGLCFSVKPGIKPPPSLVNMFKELQSDLGCRIPNHGYLVDWARQGILMLNAVLTVRAHEPNSHKDRGWENFTDAIIRAVNDKPDPVVFVLWGAYAQKKEKLIDAGKHIILKAAHPSPLSAKKFLGSRPFSAINEALENLGKTPINWELSNL